MWKLLKRIGRGNGGAVAIVLALSLPFLVGGFGLGSEVGMWYLAQRKLQNAADVAAFAAAAEVRREADDAMIRAAADRAAAASGFDASRGALLVDWSMVDGVERVSVRIEESQSRVFSRLFMPQDVLVGARAVAEITPGLRNCLLTLDPTEPGALTVGGNSRLTTIGCAIHSNSAASDSVDRFGASGIDVDCISAVGGVAGTGGNMTLRDCDGPATYVAPVADPYAHLESPPLSGSCLPSGPYSSGTLPKGRYCHGLEITGPVKLEPGIFVLEDDLVLGPHSDVDGEDGVMLYFHRPSRLKVNGHATLRLKPMSDGDYPGIVIFADRLSPNGPWKLQGNHTADISGTVYLPSVDLELAGTRHEVGCAEYVTRRFQMLGTSRVTLDCGSGSGGGLELRSLRRVRLVE